jgi:type I restriction enzyme, S subunit
MSDVGARLTQRNAVGNQNVLTISAAHGLVSQSEFFNRRVASEDVRSYYVLERGDFAYNKSYSRGCPFGVIRRLDRYDTGIVSPLYICFRPNDQIADSNFLTHYFDAGVLDEGLGDVAKEGIRNHGLLNVGVADFFSLGIRLPPFPEQRAISEVLSALDCSIREGEETVAKLKLIKQGLLHDLLTRGIDDKGELRDPVRSSELFKDSSLGRVPADWEVASVGQLVDLVTSGSRGWAQFYADAGALFVRSQNVRMGDLDLTDRQYVSVEAEEGQRTLLAPNDLLITITGNGVGNVAVVPDPWGERGFVSQHVGLVRFRDPSLGPWAMHWLSAGAPGNRQILDAQYGQSKPGLNLDNIRQFMVPLPPPSERAALLDRLSCMRWRTLVEMGFLGALRGARLGLMEDLLTGRVRVTPLLAQP